MQVIQYGSAAYYLQRWQEWQKKQQYTSAQQADRQKRSRRPNAHQITIQTATDHATHYHYEVKYPHYN